jgi:multiple sugar transport system permease protein
MALGSSVIANFPHLSAVSIPAHLTPLFGSGRINWLGEPVLAMTSVIIVNVWRGVPFYAISLLAGLQTISPELHEAAAIDGARAWQRFRHVTWPLLLPVTMVIVLFSVIQTFADFQLVYVLTGGGPANATQLFATYAYQIGIGTGLLSQGAAISLAVFPVLLVVVIVQLLYIRRVETH